MTLDETMKLLEAKGSEQTRKTFRRHGAPETMFGVKVGDLKPIAKLIKGDQKLALELFATGNSDAMYLAGLVADGGQFGWENVVPVRSAHHPQKGSIDAGMTHLVVCIVHLSETRQLAFHPVTA